MNTKILASNIQTLRLEKSWTQNDLAEFMNVSRQAVSKWETGQATPDLELLLKLSKLFSKSINALIEQPVHSSIKSIEDIHMVEKDTLLAILETFRNEELVKAAKGMSPTTLDYICSLDAYKDLESQANAIGPVKLSDVEDIHGKIVNALHKDLIQKEGDL